MRYRISQCFPPTPSLKTAHNRVFAFGRRGVRWEGVCVWEGTVRRFVLRTPTVAGKKGVIFEVSGQYSRVNADGVEAAAHAIVQLSRQDLHRIGEGP